MAIAYWIVAGLAALVFLAAGGMKAVRPIEALKNSGLKWVDDYSPGFVRFIGIVEVIGAVGLILPLLTGIAPILSPLAAVGLVIIMIGSIVIHVRRKEPWVVNIVLTLLALAAAVLGAALVF